MKKIVLLLILSLSLIGRSYAQTAEAKVNVLAGAVAIFNPSLEVGFCTNSALTIDYVGAFAEQNYLNTGYPFMISMGIIGYRYYINTKELHSGFFVGGDLGFNTFRMNKNIVPLVVNDKHSYDVGTGCLMGITLGYKYHFSNRLGLEASVSGGWQHSRHEGYTNDGVRYVELNSSGEWLPYKAGLYLTYRLFK